MIGMEMLGKIQRKYFRDKRSRNQIAKRTGRSRNTIRKWVRWHWRPVERAALVPGRFRLTEQGC
ncbi:hypothetical protein EKG40_00265 [Pseudomonas moorei]|nr:hypothetical protein EKG40_00265 [Pseudomonas moorei]